MISSALPGADQAVITGTFKSVLSTMPDTAAPMEMAHTQVIIISVEICAAEAA